MLDPKYLRQNPAESAHRLGSRGQVPALEEWLKCDGEKRKLQTELQQLEAERNRHSEEFARQKPTEEQKLRMRELRLAGDSIKHQLEKVEPELETLSLTLPNLPAANVPLGHGAKDNPVLRVWGEDRHIVNPRNHMELGHNLFDSALGVKLAGNGFMVTRGPGAKLERALEGFLLEQATSRGYEEIRVPLLVRRECAVGTGQLPKFEEQLYHTREGLVLTV